MILRCMTGQMTSEQKKSCKEISIAIDAANIRLCLETGHSEIIHGPHGRGSVNPTSSSILFNRLSPSSFFCTVAV